MYWNMCGIIYVYRTSAHFTSYHVLKYREIFWKWILLPPFWGRLNQLNWSHWNSLKKYKWLCFLSAETILVSEVFKKVKINTYFECRWIKGEKQGTVRWGCIEEKVKNMRLSLGIQKCKKYNVRSGHWKTWLVWMWGRHWTVKWMRTSNVLLSFSIFFCFSIPASLPFGEGLPPTLMVHVVSVELTPPISSKDSQSEFSISWATGLI